MPYELIDGDPDPSAVRRLTFVPFLPDGRCVALPGPKLLTAEVRPGEHYLLDVCLRVPLAALGFRPQRVHPFAVPPHRPAPAPAVTRPAGGPAARCSSTACTGPARFWIWAVPTDCSWSRCGSGLPHWSGRIEVGSAIDYVPADGRRFTFVHVLLDAVPRRRRPDLVSHALATLVAPGGRLLVSHYQGDGGTDLTAAEHLRALGFEVAGSSHAQGTDRGATTAWLPA